MLVLTRRVNQAVTIGGPADAEDPIEITVIEVRGDQVRLAVLAPKDKPVHRKEVWVQIQGEAGASRQGQHKACPSDA